MAVSVLYHIIVLNVPEYIVFMFMTVPFMYARMSLTFVATRSTQSKDLYTSTTDSRKGEEEEGRVQCVTEGSRLRKVMHYFHFVNTPIYDK
eukprot:5838636-Pleurochrysis_carterae.AAC.1